MSLGKWAFVFCVGWVVVAAVDNDVSDRSQTKPTAYHSVDSPNAVAKPIKPISTTLAVPNPESRRRLYVTGSVVNVRRGPGTAHAKLFQLRKGQAVTELETHEGWTKLSFNSRSGWMSANYLSPNEPTSAIARVSTARVPQCHPNYSGGCVPIASDVDCAGGSGNGPAFVRGPVLVIGRDVYRLDRDKDGIGCE